MLCVHECDAMTMTVAACRSCVMLLTDKVLDSVEIPCTQLASCQTNMRWPDRMKRMGASRVRVGQVKTITILILYLLAYWIDVVVVDGDANGNDGDASSLYRKKEANIWLQHAYAIPPSTISLTRCEHTHTEKDIQCEGCASRHRARHFVCVLAPKTTASAVCKDVTKEIFFVGLNTELTAVRTHMDTDSSSTHLCPHIPRERASEWHKQWICETGRSTEAVAAPSPTPDDNSSKWVEWEDIHAATATTAKRKIFGTTYSILCVAVE